jgi:hypothetical protein
MLPLSLDCPFLLSLRYYPTFICPVSCVPYVASFSGLSFFIALSVFSSNYLSCVQCTLWYQLLWIGLFHCPFGILSHLFCPVSCVPYVACFSRLSFLLLRRYSLALICPVSCAPYVTSFSGLSFSIAPSVLSNIYLSCVLCTLCCQFLWIVLFHCPFGILLHLFVLELVYPMLPCCLFLSIVLFYCPFGII